MSKLREKITALPEAPGVYLFKDATGAVIYIGKAKSLHKRVASYFGRPQSGKNQALVSKIADIEYRLTQSESQAQVLEAALVSEKQPQYNIDLKDDKSFPLIKITDEAFPVVSICRRKKPLPGDTAQYLGPYTDSQALREVFNLTRRIFGFRTCRNMPDRECLYFRLKLCPAPCIGLITHEEYQKIIEDIRLFLGSRYEELSVNLVRQMSLAAKQKRFEDAARFRDQISALSAIQESGPDAGLNEVEDLKRLLKLDKLPRRIEGFDISNISGKSAVGSMVSFYDGLPDKNNYRRFKIKTVSKVDDYKMMAEVVYRRYFRLINEERPLPDLVLIDGGKQHLAVADNAIRDLGLKLTVISIAKEKENIYLQGKVLPLRYRRGSPALNLIRRVRDEAHRFAVSYHHLLRRKNILGK